MDSRESPEGLVATACPQTAPHLYILPEKCAPVPQHALKIPEKPSIRLDNLAHLSPLFKREQII